MVTSRHPPTYLIYRASLTDLDDLMAFIHQHWKENHILSCHKELLKWQHYDPRDEGLNFIIARDNASEAILGVLGYIDTSLYDAALSGERVLWMALWAVDPECQVAGLGLSLRQFLQNLGSYRAIGVLGFTEKITMLYKAFQYETGFLGRYYLVNRLKKRFDLIQEFDGRYLNLKAATKSKKQLNSIDLPSFEQFEHSFQFEHPSDLFPKKTPRYFLNRYLKHPMYNYRLFGIREAGQYLGLIATRRAEGNGSAALRIVDYLGPDRALSGLSEPFQNLLAETDCEYLDFYSHGINESDLFQAGLLKFFSSQSMVLPTYFEPLEFQNDEINYAIKPSQDAQRYRFFKGDGDQDRPSVWE